MINSQKIDWCERTHPIAGVKKTAIAVGASKTKRSQKTLPTFQFSFLFSNWF